MNEKANHLISFLVRFQQGHFFLFAVDMNSNEGSSKREGIYADAGVKKLDFEVSVNHWSSLTN